MIWRTTARAAAALLAAAMLLAGCLPQSKQPIDSLDHAIPEARLAGVWTGTADDETIYAHFLPDGAAFDVVVVSHRQGTDGPGGSWSHYWLYPTRLGEQTYFNAHQISDGGKPSDAEWFYFVRYQIAADGALSLWTMSPDAVEKAVDQGLKVKGTRDNFGVDLTIDATSAEIRDWLQKADQAKLFPEQTIVLKKAAP